MDTTVIISIIISTIVALAIVALVVVLFYYHWRNWLFPWQSHTGPYFSIA